MVNAADGLGTFNGTIDEAMLFQVPLPADEVKGAMRGYSDPVATDAQARQRPDRRPHALSLSWTAANTPQRTTCTSGPAREVDAADRTSPPGVLASQAQAETTFDPAGPLDIGKTYYWRVDEVNGPPTQRLQGQVWSFTVEPYAIRSSP